MTCPYQTLGIGRDASQDEVRAAYRARIRATHPDREGGSHDEAQAVNAAYSLLSDPARRAHYDKTGETKDQTAQLLLEVMRGALELALTNADRIRGDLVDYARGQIRERLEVNAGKMRTFERERDKLRRLQGRISGPSKNLAADLIAQALENAERDISALKQAMDLQRAAIEGLAEYQDEVAARMVEGPSHPDPFEVMLRVDRSARFRWAP